MLTQHSRHGNDWCESIREGLGCGVDSDGDDWRVKEAWADNGSTRTRHKAHTEPRERERERDWIYVASGVSVPPEN